MEENYKERCERKAKAVPLEIKQKLLDLLREGKTVGEAGELCGLEFEEYSQIVYENISEVNFLNSKAE